MWQPTFSLSDFGLRKQLTFLDAITWDQEQFSSLFVNEILSGKGLRDPVRENLWKLLNWTFVQFLGKEATPGGLPVVFLRNNVWETSADDDVH